MLLTDWKLLKVLRRKREKRLRWLEKRGVYASWFMSDDEIDELIYKECIEDIRKGKFQYKSNYENVCIDCSKTLANCRCSKICPNCQLEQKKCDGCGYCISCCLCEEVFTGSTLRRDSD